MTNMLVEAVGDVTSMVKKLQSQGFQIHTPRLYFTGTGGSGVRTVTESMLGLHLIPHKLRYPLEIKFVHVTNISDIWCSLNFNEKRYKYPTDSDLCRKDIMDHVTTISDSPADGVNDLRVIVTIESSRVPDLDVMKFVDQDVLGFGESDIAIVVIAANGLPNDSIVSRMKLCKHHPVGVLTKLDLVNTPTVSRILIGNILSLPFGLTGVAINEELPSNWFSNHPYYSNLPPEFTGLDTVMKKLKVQVASRYAQIIRRMKPDIDAKRKSLSDRLEELGEAIPETDEDKKLFLDKMCATFVTFLKKALEGENLRQDFWNACSPLINYSPKIEFSNEEKSHLKTLWNKNKGLSMELFDEHVKPIYSQIDGVYIKMVNEMVESISAINEEQISKMFYKYPQVAKFYRDFTMSLLSARKDRSKSEILQFLRTSRLFCNLEDVRVLLQLKPCGECQGCRYNISINHGCNFYKAKEYNDKLSEIAKRICGGVASVVSSMIYSICAELPSAFDAALCRIENPCALLTEDPKITEERETIMEQLKTLADVDAFLETHK